MAFAASLPCLRTSRQRREVWLSYLSLLDRVPAGLDAVGDFLGGLAADEIDHAGPERARTNGARHQVGAVEAEGRARQQDLAFLLQRLVAVGFDIGELVG